MKTYTEKNGPQAGESNTPSGQTDEINDSTAAPHDVPTNPQSGWTNAINHSTYHGDTGSGLPASCDSEIMPCDMASHSSDFQVHVESNTIRSRDAGDNSHSIRSRLLPINNHRSEISRTTEWTTDTTDDTCRDTDIETDVIESKSKQDEDTSSVSDIQTLNMVYIMFWNFFGTFLTTILLFWVDLIPGFGLLPDIHIFGKQ